MFQVLFLTLLLMLTTASTLVIITPFSSVEETTQGHATGEKLSYTCLPLFQKIWRQSVKVFAPA